MVDSLGLGYPQVPRSDLIEACEESGLWERALEIFQSPKSFTNIVGINAGIAAGGRGPKK